jgi:hypothetical protein
VTIIFATDLDRTMIYSKRAREAGDAEPPPQVCAEIHDGKQASFMTVAAAATLTALARVGLVVPVTTRINEQYRRVRLPGPAPAYAVTTNGGEILVDDEPDAAWSKQVAKRLRAGFPLAEVWEQASHLCRPEFTVKLRNADGMFCYAVVQTKHLPPGFVDDVAGWAAERGWRTSLQGRKLYWVPESLTKSSAIAEVAQRVGGSRILAAGDSLLDVDLLLAADRGIHPRHGELYEQGWSAPTVDTTQASGILAGEEITAWFASTALS